MVIARLRERAVSASASYDTSALENSSTTLFVFEEGGETEKMWVAGALSRMDWGLLSRSSGRCREKNWCNLKSLSPRMGCTYGGDTDGGGIETRAKLGELCSGASSGVLSHGVEEEEEEEEEDMSSTVPPEDEAVEVGCLSFFETGGTTFGGLAELKYLPPPGLEEKNEE